MKILIRLAEIANQLDDKKLYRLADDITNALVKLSAAPAAPNANLPLTTRVIPYNLINETEEEQEKTRKLFPEYQDPPSEPDATSDDEAAEDSIFRLDGGKGTGIKMRVNDPRGMGYNDPNGTSGLFNFDNYRDDNNRGYPKFIGR